MTVKNTRKNTENLKRPWRPGESGNPKGRPPRHECITSLLKEAMDKKCPSDKQKRTWAEVLTEKLLKMARSGDIAALRMIYEYVDGKPKQEIVIPPKDVTIHVKYADGIKGVSQVI